MHISILACGWLGQPLALQLQDAGHTVMATCRSAAKQQELQDLGIRTELYNLGDNLNSDALNAVLQAEVLVLNIPPGARHIQADFYCAQMCNLVEQARQSGTQKLLFISTTAVYGDADGEMTEQSPCLATTPSALAHQQIEQRVQDVFGNHGAVLRLAGLVGQKRHPAHYLAGKTALSEPLHAVNLIHQYDVIQAIQAILRLPHLGQVFHLAAHEHPTRETYYQWACDQLGLPRPSFEHSLASTGGKRINASWTCDKLGLQLRYPSPYDMLK